MNKILGIFTTILMALAMIFMTAFATALPATAFDSPDGLKCPTRTMDGHWADFAMGTNGCMVYTLSSNGGDLPTCNVPAITTGQSLPCYNPDKSVRYH